MLLAEPPYNGTNLPALVTPCRAPARSPSPPGDELNPPSEEAGHSRDGRPMQQRHGSLEHTVCGNTHFRTWRSARNGWA